MRGDGSKVQRCRKQGRCKVQELGCGARVKGAGCGAGCKLQRCRKQGAVLLHTEPVEGGIVGRSELKADAAIDH